MGDAHPGDVPDVAGTVAAAVQEPGGNGPVEPASGPNVPRAALAGQRSGRAGNRSGQPADNVDGEDSREDGSREAHLNAQDPARGGHRRLPLLLPEPICSNATYRD